MTDEANDVYIFHHHYNTYGDENEKHIVSQELILPVTIKSIKDAKVVGSIAYYYDQFLRSLL